HLLCLRQSLGKSRAFNLRSLRPKSKELFKARIIARRCYHIQPCISCNVQRRLTKSRRRAAKKESLPLFDLQVAIEAGPCRGVGLRYYRELLPRHIRCDLHDICRRDKRQFRVTTIDRSAHAAHECGYFVAGLKFSSGRSNYLTHALNSADL